MTWSIIGAILSVALGPAVFLFNLIDWLSGLVSWSRS